MPDTIIQTHNITKDFQVGKQTINVLKGINVSIDRGDFVIIIGPSGCGKSTLLNILLGLEPPTTGSINTLGHDVTKFTEDEHAELRKKHFGMVYQQANWIKSLNVIDNVSLPLQLLGSNLQEAHQLAIQQLKQIGMEDWAHHIPTELSSGQQQRINLARALITNPDIIIADEPTGNLDFASGEKLMHMLSELNHLGRTILMVTHDLEYIKFGNKVIKLFDGMVDAIIDENNRDEFMSTLKYKRQSQIDADTADQSEQPQTSAIDQSIRNKQSQQTVNFPEGNQSPKNEGKTIKPFSKNNLVKPL